MKRQWLQTSGAFQAFGLVLFLFFVFFCSLLPPVHVRVFFFFKWTDLGPVTARFRLYRPKLETKKKKISATDKRAAASTAAWQVCISDLGAPAQSVHPCFLVHISPIERNIRLQYSLRRDEGG